MSFSYPPCPSNVYLLPTKSTAFPPPSAIPTPCATSLSICQVLMAISLNIKSQFQPGTALRDQSCFRKVRKDSRNPRCCWDPPLHIDPYTGGWFLEARNSSVLVHMQIVRGSCERQPGWADLAWGLWFCISSWGCWAAGLGCTPYLCYASQHPFTKCVLLTLTDENRAPGDWEMCPRTLSWRVVELGSEPS